MEKRPRRYQQVRVDGRMGIVIRVDYGDERVRIKFTDKRGGVLALELDRFYDQWDGRKWDILPESEYDYPDERRDVQIYFDWCWCDIDPKPKLPNALKKKRLYFLARYLFPDDPRHQMMEDVYGTRPNAAPYPPVRRPGRYSHQLGEEVSFVKVESALHPSLVG